VEAVRPTPGKRVEYFDLEVPGLTLRVTPTGAKSWCVLYRHRARLRRLTLGALEKLTLAQARDRARDALYAAGKGADPAAEKIAGRKAETVEDLAKLYLEKWAMPRKRSWRADRNLLNRKVLPRWRRRAIVDITRQDVRLLVEAVADAGAPVVANRVASLLSKMFSFALDRDLINASPAVRIPRPIVEHSRDRVLSEDELRTIWGDCDALSPAMSSFYKLRLLTAQRGGEVATMRWRDVDLHSGWWTIPSAVAKNKLAHRVPLSGTALGILEELRATADQVLAAQAAAGRKIEAPVYALEGARGKRQQAEAAAVFGVEDFRGHDLRRTAASMMASGGIARLTISKILNHVERSVTATYDRHSYDPEKRAALDWWDAELARIVRAKRLSIVA
jgi:integrase